MVIRLLLAALVLIAVGPSAAHALNEARTESQWSDGDELLAESLTSLGAPGGAWAVVRDDKVVHVGVAGKDGTGKPVAKDTPFLLGSVSKPLLATLVMDMVTADAARLSDRVYEQVPALADIPDGKLITVEQLLRHTSGLPFGAKWLDIDEPDRTASQVVEQLEGLNLEDRPGQTYTYSSLGFIVLTAWYEKLTGTSVAEAAANRWDITQQVPPGRRDLFFPLQDAPRDGAGAGYGYSASSIESFARFAVDSLSDQQRLAAMSKGRPDQGETLTGRGWRVTNDADGQRRVWHTGMVPGYFSAVHLLPEENLGIVFLTNRSGYLDQTRLYEASDALLQSARGEDTSAPGMPTNHLLLTVAAVCIGSLAIVLMRRRISILRWLGRTLALLLLVSPFLAAWLMGMPWRYLWLWAPYLGVVLSGAGLCALLAGLRTRSVTSS